MGTENISPGINPNCLSSAIYFDVLTFYQQNSFILKWSGISDPVLEPIKLDLESHNSIGWKRSLRLSSQAESGVKLRQFSRERLKVFQII